VRLAQVKRLWPGCYLEILKITLVALKINVSMNPAMNGWPLPSAFQFVRRMTEIQLLLLPASRGTLL
jgi:hypothetical protein